MHGSVDSALPNARAKDDAWIFICIHVDGEPSNISDSEVFSLCNARMYLLAQSELRLL